MTWICKSCNTENKAKFRFCSACGTPRPAETAVAEPAPTERPRADREAPVAGQAVGQGPSAAGTRPSGSAATVSEETGWRCHECWKINPNDAPACSECGTGHVASDRANLRDRVFGGFGRFGKWPFVILFVVAVIGGVGWLYYYLNPKHGETIEAPAGLEAEITASLDEVSKRLPEQTVFYNCYSTTVGGKKESGGYAVLVRLVPRSSNIANRAPESGADPDRFWQFIAHRDGYKWKLERFRIAGFDSVADPCNNP